MSRSAPRRNPSRTSKSSQKLPSVIEADDPAALISSSSSFDAERKDLSPTKGHTPVGRKRSRGSTPSSQKVYARTADPNHGSCLITHLDDPVETCHLIAGSTDSTTTTRLEFAWGLGYRTLNLDTRFNLFFLTPDWHTLFDRGSWLLIPQLEDLQRLQTASLSKKRRGRVALDKFWTQESFKYNILAMPGLAYPAVRLIDDQYTVYRYPYPGLGDLTSHIQPHFVVVNAGRKLIRSTRHLLDLARSLQTVSPNGTLEVAVDRLQLILNLYDRWLQLEIPVKFATSGGGSYHDTSSQAPSESESSPSTDGDGNEPQEERGEGLRKTSIPSKTQSRIREPQDDIASQSTDITALDDEWNSSEETAWIEDVCNWVEKCDQAALCGPGWETEVLNVGQVGAYAEEPSRPAPSEESWHGWRPQWEPRKWNQPHFFNTAKFSSNDWAIYEKCCTLTGTTA